MRRLLEKSADVKCLSSPIAGGSDTRRLFSTFKTWRFASLLIPAGRVTNWLFDKLRFVIFVWFNTDSGIVVSCWPLMSTVLPLLTPVLLLDELLWWLIK